MAGDFGKFEISEGGRQCWERREKEKEKEKEEKRKEKKIGKGEEEERASGIRSKGGNRNEGKKENVWNENALGRDRE